MSKLVPYYRVSTKRQGESGLGLEAQQFCVADFARQGQHEIIASYQEIETGKRADRPELAKAIAHAKRTKATLVIAKLDRLARNVHFLSGLMEASVEFVCCDMPFGQPADPAHPGGRRRGRGQADQRADQGRLGGYKARGGTLGTLANLTREAGKRGAVTNRAKARTAYASLLPQLREWRAAGLSFARISTRLNDSGHTTRSGALWNPAQVRRVLARASV